MAEASPTDIGGVCGCLVGVRLELRRLNVQAQPNTTTREQDPEVQHRNPSKSAISLKKMDFQRVGLDVDVTSA